MMNDDTGRRKRVVAALTCGALCVALLAWLLPLAAQLPLRGYAAKHLEFFPPTWTGLWTLAVEIDVVVGIVVITLCLMLYFWWIAWEPEPKYKARGSRTRPWMP